MKIFITGGTGHIGSATIPHLLASGHTVSVLTRSPKSAEAAKALGCEPIMGTHLDLSTLSSAAANADAVIHLAFNHDDFSDFPKVCAEDRAAISAMCDTLTGKPFVCASGTLMTAGETEECGKIPIEAMPRWKSEDLVKEYSAKGVKGMIVRFPPVVHGPDRQHPFIAAQIEGAKKAGSAGYIGEGKQVWPSCHVDDTGKLVALALEKGMAGVYHAVAEEGIEIKDIAEFIAGKLGVEAKSISKEEAAERYAFVGALMDMDNRSTSDITKENLGWKPVGCGLLEEMQGYTF